MLRREKRSQEQYLAGNLRIGPVRAPRNSDCSRWMCPDLEWISEQPGARKECRQSGQKYYRDGNTKASGNRISEYTMGIWDDEFVPIIGYF